MRRYVANSTSIWSGSQQAQCIAAIMRSADPNTKDYDTFYTWYFAYLRNHSSPETGYWLVPHAFFFRCLSAII